MEKKGVWAFATNEVGHLFIEDVIESDLYKDLRAQLDTEPLKSASSLVVHIKSPGGNVYAGYNAFHVLRSSGKPITSLIEGEAQSMATFISLAGSKKIDKKNGGIFILNPSTYMIHNPSSGNEGTADALQGTVDELRKIEDEMSLAYSIQTGKSQDEMKAMMKKETRMTAIEAKTLGFVDDINNQLKAVAIGKSMEKDKEKSIIDKIAKALGLNEVKAIDFKIANGKSIHVEAEAGGEVGKQATMDGVAVPDGSYPLEDGTGRIITVASGLITKIEEKQAVPAPAPAPNPEEALKAQIAALTNQLATQTLQATQAAAEKATAEAEKLKMVTALAEIKKDLEKPLGSQDNPNDMNLSPSRVPIAVGSSGPNALMADATKSFLIAEMPSIEQYYPRGYFDKYKAGGPNAVSILETNFNYVYPGILTTDIFYKPTLSAPALSDFGMVDQDIKFSKKYNLVTQLDKIVQPYTGCGGTPAGNRQLITNTQVDTKEFQVYEGWCKDDFTGQLTGVYNFLAQEWLKTGLRQFDPAGTPIDTVIMTVMKDAIQRDILRRFFFAAGNSSDSDYNQFDGVWDRLIDTSGAANYCVRRAGTSIAGTISSAQALTYLAAVYTAASPLLKNDSTATFFVTRTVWDAYYDALIGTGAVTEQAFSNIQNGVNGGASGMPTLRYKGYPVIAVDLWDQFLLETDNPLYAGGSQRNLILFTTKKNHIFGVENAADLNKIESWYENKDQKRYYRANFKLGYNYLHCDLAVISY